MRVQPVRRYAVPSYPTRAYLLEHPELLRWLPKRWQRNPLVLAVLGMALPLLQACSTADTPQGGNPATIRVAPLFVHGDGRGGFGCVAVNPPVFLSEDEAQDVIRDEAKNAGLDLAKTDLTLNGILLPVTDQFAFIEEETRGDKSAKREKTQKGNLNLDGYDQKHHVAFEFVSQEDFEAWEPQDRSEWASASEYDLKTTAKRLRQGVAQARGNTIVGVFYEPSAKVSEDSRPTVDSDEASWKAYWKAREQAGKKIGEQELRAQVRDFLEWLKGQGVL